ncbi:MAG: SpoIIIAC/SpoIIIAD family protein [Hydrogenoanaerobacterium sp.]
MDITAIIGLGVLGAALAVIMKQYKPEYALAVSLLVGILIFTAISDSIKPVLESLEDILKSTQVPYEYVEILLKALGICYITQIACDTCKDAGQSAISTKVEIAGKLAVLVISLPLFKALMDIVAALLSA